MINWEPGGARFASRCGRYVFIGVHISCLNDLCDDDSNIKNNRIVPD